MFTNHKNSKTSFAPINQQKKSRVLPGHSKTLLPQNQPLSSLVIWTKKCMLRVSVFHFSQKEKPKTWQNTKYKHNVSNTKTNQKWSFTHLKWCWKGATHPNWPVSTAVLLRRFNPQITSELMQTWGLNSKRGSRPWKRTISTSTPM